MLGRFDFGKALSTGYLRRRQAVLEQFLETACPFRVGGACMYLQIDRLENLVAQRSGKWLQLSGTALLQQPIKGKATHFMVRFDPKTRKFDYHFHAPFTLVDLFRKKAFPLMSTSERQCCERLLMPLFEACDKPSITLSDHGGTYEGSSYGSGLTVKALLQVADFDVLRKISSSFKNFRLPQSPEAQILFPANEDGELNFRAMLSMDQTTHLGHPAVQLQRLRLDLNQGRSSLEASLIFDFSLAFAGADLAFRASLEQTAETVITGSLVNPHKIWLTIPQFPDLQIQQLEARLRGHKKSPHLGFDADGRARYRGLDLPGKFTLHCSDQKPLAKALEIQMNGEQNLARLVRALTGKKTNSAAMGHMTFSDLRLTFATDSFTSGSVKLQEGIHFSNAIKIHQMTGHIEGLLNPGETTTLNGRLDPIHHKIGARSLFSFTGDQTGTGPGVAITNGEGQAPVRLFGRIGILDVITGELEIEASTKGMTVTLENEGFGLFNRKVMTIKNKVFRVSATYGFQTEFKIFGAEIPISLHTLINLEIDETGITQSISGNTRIFHRSFDCPETVLTIPCLDGDQIPACMSQACITLKEIIKKAFCNPDESMVRWVRKKCKLNKRKTGRFFRAAGADQKLLCRLFQKVFDCSLERAAGYAAGNRRDEKKLLAEVN